MVEITSKQNETELEDTQPLVAKLPEVAHLPHGASFEAAMPRLPVLTAEHAKWLSLALLVRTPLLLVGGCARSYCALSRQPPRK